METLLDNFSTNNRSKVEMLIAEWKDVKAGTAEIIFRAGNETRFRACPYPDGDNHLIVVKAAGSPLGNALVQKFGAKELSQGHGVRISLNTMTSENLLSFLDMMY